MGSIGFGDTWKKSTWGTCAVDHSWAAPDSWAALAAPVAMLLHFIDGDCV